MHRIVESGGISSVVRRVSHNADMPAMTAHDTDRILATATVAPAPASTGNAVAASLAIGTARAPAVNPAKAAGMTKVDIRSNHGGIS
jgi:hypothetical protein